MSTVTCSSKINAPLEQVFDVFTDFSNAADRIQGIKSLEVLTDGPIGKGTQFRETRIMFGKEATEQMEITDFQLNKSYRVEAESCGSHYISEYKFQSEKDGTLVELSFTGKPISWMGKLMSPMFFLMKNSVKKCLEDDFLCLKQFIERDLSVSSGA